MTKKIAGLNVLPWLVFPAMNHSLPGVTLSPLHFLLFSGLNKTKMSLSIFSLVSNPLPSLRLIQGMIMPSVQAKSLVNSIKG